MFKKTAISLAVCAALLPGAANAGFDLLGVGSLSGLISDLSSATAGPLENGVPGNLLGGMGSGFAYAGGGVYLALPDRGPNASTYNTAVDNTTSYINRFQTLSLNLTPTLTGVTVAPTLSATTLLYSASPLNYGSGAGLGLGSGAPSLNSANMNYFTGRSDNYATGVSTNANNARLDPEAIRVTNDGKSVFISDEYGPYVYKFDRATGERTGVYSLPSTPGTPNNLAIANPNPVGSTEAATNTSGRTNNKGMEGLAITPDGQFLIGIMQAPLLQDSTSNTVRIVRINVATGASEQFAYKLTSSGVSEIVAINANEFLVLERDGKGLGDNSSAAFKKVFRISLTGATEISGLSGNAIAAAGVPVAKTQVMDVLALLTAPVSAGGLGLSVKDIPAKFEGMAFGEDVVVNGILRHTLILSTDNDFLGTVTDSNHPTGIANPNNFYVFGFGDADLPGYTAQDLAPVPLPAAAWLLLGGLGMLGFRTRRTAA